MNKLIDYTKFTCGVSWIRHVAFDAGEESGHVGLKVEVDVGTYDQEANNFLSSHTSSLEDALLAFSTMDNASLLSLSQLDMAGQRHLCAFNDVDDPMDGAGGEYGDSEVGVGGGETVVGGVGNVVYGGVVVSGGHADGDGGVVDGETSRSMICNELCCFYILCFVALCDFLRVHLNLFVIVCLFVLSWLCTLTWSY